MHNLPTPGATQIPPLYTLIHEIFLLNFAEAERCFLLRVKTVLYRYSIVRRFDSSLEVKTSTTVFNRIATPNQPLPFGLYRTFGPDYPVHIVKAVA